MRQSRVQKKPRRVSPQTAEWRADRRWVDHGPTLVYNGPQWRWASLRAVEPYGTCRSARIADSLPRLGKRDETHQPDASATSKVNTESCDVYWVLLVLFLCLILLSQWLTKHVQGVGYLLTGNGQMGLILYFVLILPGILIHEISHALVAWLLRVRVEHLAVGIRHKAEGDQVALGSVDIESTDPIRASLIGLAPLVSGCVVILVITGRALDVQLDTVPTLQSFWQALGQTYQAPDSGLWVYLILATGNAMLPSASDRRSWGVAIGLFLFMGALAYFSGLVDALSAPAERWIQAGADRLVYAFGITVLADVVLAACLFLAEQGLALLGFGRLRYR
jgi:hypothetical protein